MLKIGLELTFTIEYLILMPLCRESMPEMGMEVTQLTSGCRGMLEMDIEVIREDSQFGLEIA